MLNYLKTITVAAAIALVSCSSSKEEKNPLADQLRGKVCDSWRDSAGILHLRAADELTSFACFGYAHGLDRPWQMDLLRRIAQGRRAEIQGRAMIRSDFLMRMMALDDLARRIFDEMTDAQKQPYWAYAWGANRGMRVALENGAYEFKYFGYEPEPWQPTDSIALILLQSFDQTRRGFEHDLQENEWIKTHGPEAAAIFSIDHLPWDTAVLKTPSMNLGGNSTLQSSESPESSKSALPIKEANFLSAFGQSGQTPPTGSNNWVIAPQRSTDQTAWLANDPHLALTHPPFWHWLHLSSADFDIVGSSLPGVPLIASGATRSVAWGLTNSYLKASSITAANRENLKSTTTQRPLIWVKVWKFKVPFFFKTFQRTESGSPILPINDIPGKSLVLNWSGFHLQPADFKGFARLMGARDIGDLDRAFADIGVPSWNFVFADTRGGIGLRTVGKIPRIPSVIPFGIPESASPSGPGQWSDWLRPSEMPHLQNPASGFIVTANNRHWPAKTSSNESVYSGRTYVQGFRAFRIEELLQQRPKHDLESQRKIQCDVQAVDARFLLPPLLNLLEGEIKKHTAFRNREMMGMQALQRWDYQAGLKCDACSIYRRWVDRLMDDQNLNETALYRLLKRPEVEKLRKPILANFLLALDDIGVQTSGKLPLWGTTHQAHFEHLSKEDDFAHSSIGTPGDENSVNPGTSDWKEGGYQHTHGASERLLVKLTHPPQIYLTLPGPNQNQEAPKLNEPRSPWSKWIDCELDRVAFPLDWSKVTTTPLSL